MQEKVYETVIAELNSGYKRTKSSMTLFGFVSDNNIFDRVLARYYDGEKDKLTINILKSEA